MNVYEIIITDNTRDGRDVWYFKDSDISEKSVKDFFRKKLFANAVKTGCKPKRVLIYPGNAETLLHGIVQFDNFHMEATLIKYSEEVFLQRVAVDERSPSDYVLAKI